ncbi:MAG: exopolyphosphatase/guanosine-5'-triphosphate,3'-diphosphate pyrophosphatase, partial [bacterium]
MNQGTDKPQSVYAAIDLGSNSFHMLVATPEGNSIRKIDSLRMPTRLAAGLDKNKRLLPETEALALDALAKFSERLRDVPRENIRVVGTNT